MRYKVFLKKINRAINNYFQVLKQLLLVELSFLRKLDLSKKL